MEGAHERWFDSVPEEMKLRLPDGTLLHDTAIIPNFCESVLGLKHDKIWHSLSELSHFEGSEAIPLGNGDNPQWVRGSHPALHYRGNDITRNKVWFQTGFDDGMRKYGYTGWQWMIAGATHRVESVPAVAELGKAINEKLGLQRPHDHWIATGYNDGSQCIGPHSDKTRDWRSDSCFVVVKFGAKRRFEFTWDEPAVAEAKAALKRAERKKDKPVIKIAKAALSAAIKNRKYAEVFYSKILPAGAGVIVGVAANALVKHGVPAENEEEKCGPSGSIVARSIATVVPWSAVADEQRKRGAKADVAMSDAASYV